MKRTALLLASLSFSVCVNAQEATQNYFDLGSNINYSAQIATADYGSPMTEDQVQATARRYFDMALKDPYSAKIDCGDYKKGWLSDASKLIYGYRVTCLVNAKNSYGGYTSTVLYEFVMRDGSVAIAKRATGSDGHLERVL